MPDEVKDTPIKKRENFYRIADNSMEMISMDTEIGTGNVAFEGVASFEGTIGGRNFRSNPTPFPIEAESIQEAFDKFKESAKPAEEKVLEQIKREISGQRISPIAMPGSELSPEDLSKIAQGIIADV
jgi:hypothetical protein